jgi:hypothetical protein
MNADEVGMWAHTSSSADDDWNRRLNNAADQRRVTEDSSIKSSHARRVARQDWMWLP